MTKMNIEEPRINPDRESKLRDLIDKNPNLEFIPIPSVIERLMKTASLEVLDTYLNPGVAGAAFHYYRMTFISRLIRNTGIRTYKELSEEAQKIIINKSSKLSSANRKSVVAELNYFVSKLKSAQDQWDSATEEERELALELEYLIKTNNDNSRDS